MQYEHKMTSKNLQKLVNQYIDYEQLVRYELGLLPNAGSECKYDHKETVFIIDHGKHFTEVHEYCTTCGGFKTP